MRQGLKASAKTTSRPAAPVITRDDSAALWHAVQAQKDLVRAMAGDAFTDEQRQAEATRLQKAQTALRKVQALVRLQRAQSGHAGESDELERLRAEVKSWRTRGRGPMLHDPENAGWLETQKQRMRDDPAYARKMLQEAGILNAAGKLSRRFGGGSVR